MTTPRTWLAAAEAGETAEALRAIANLRKLINELEVIHVRNARSQGWSWGEIAEELGVSKQAVHRKHAKHRNA
ncbi:HTH domain-containing protein [Amycolatopsis echigonensis]|uniref:HTH domain-containing protein n=1 Tax=Amycolatopsis echigonensis TaxID=2576905 RepID=A0A2N3WJA0_9PSEU|nr:HTH domain-containing protein [Amycolatopsis niigatensis]PKV93950.1 HTH domain-containing protein [Amycolatopsis niigatensis]